MAQVRDKQTSELLYEGEPDQCALVGQAIGFDTVLFDGVGMGFDPQAVLTAREQNIAGLEAAATDTKLDKDVRDAAARNVADVKARGDVKKHVTSAKTRQTKARERVG